MLFFSGGPVWNFETFENSAWVSVETHITYTLKKSRGMEILSVQMHHDVWLLVELVGVDILHAHAYNNKLNQLI